MNVGDPGALDAATGAALSAESADGTSVVPSEGSGAPASMQQQKRMLPVSDDERIAKLLKTETTASVTGGTTMASSAQANAMAATRAMFGSAPSGGGAALPGTNHNLFFMGSQSMQPGLNMAMSQPMMGTNAAQQAQLQLLQRQQQYAAAVAAQRNASASPFALQQQQQQQQQQQSQAAFMTNIVGQQSGGMAMNSQQIAQPAAQYEPQMHAIPAMNMHVASLMASQGGGFLGNTTSAVSAAQHPPSSASIIMQENQQLQQQAVGAAEMDHACLICKKQGDIFTCNGGCGLHVHPVCIGEDVIFPISVGQLCGSCFIMQQNRASTEDVTKGGTHVLSIRRAIMCVNLETNSQMNFERFGHLASLRLGEIGSIAGYPIKPFAETFIEPFLQRWMREKLVRADKWMLHVRDVFNVMIGLYSLKRACIAHGMHEWVVDLVKARKFSVMDFLGWHPAIESPNVLSSSLCAICGIRNPPEVDICTRCHRKLAFPSVFTKYISSLLATFYAEEVGIPLGATALDVFGHTNTIRSMYKGLRPVDPDGILWEPFSEQLRMIFGLLDIMSNFGVLQLNPALFEPEVKIIFNANYVNHVMLATEYEIAGKFLQCMKLFGHAKTAENANLIAGCERFLLFKQLTNGSWCKLGGTTVDQYKATITCAKALATPQFRGCGPLSKDFQRLLEKWAQTSPANPSAPGKRSSDAAKAKLLVCGTTVKPNTSASFKRLEALYKRQIAPKSDGITLEALMTARMKKLLKAKLEAESVHEGAASSTEIKTEVKGEAGTVKTEASAVKKEDNVVKEEVIAAKEEGFADSTTDSEDAKAEHKEQATLAQPEPSSGTVDAREGEKKTQDDDDDDVLTNMSLSEDLEIFDGLKFEDGGGIIDVSLHPMEAAHDEEADGDVAHDDGSAADDADGTDAAAQDDDEEEEEVEEEEMEEMMDDAVYDDDNDEENGPAVTEGAHVEDTDAHAPLIEADTANPGEISSAGDFDT